MSDEDITRIARLANQLATVTAAATAAEDDRVVQDAREITAALTAAAPALPHIVNVQTGRLVLVKDLNRFADLIVGGVVGTAVLETDANGQLYEVVNGRSIPRSAEHAARIIGVGAATAIITELTNVLRRRMPAHPAAGEPK